LRYFRTEYSMRADQISQQVFGTVDYTKDIIRLNPEISTQLVLPVGTIVKLPEIKTVEPKGVNLWQS